jgi:hypothetical protein
VTFVDIDATVVHATRAPGEIAHGLVTLDVRLPGWVQREFLTHKRISRSFVSARALSATRLSELGFYRPMLFYKQGPGMTSSDEPLDETQQYVARELWEAAALNGIQLAMAYEQMGVAKEQGNRVMQPDLRMFSGLLTATEDAWSAFFGLRVSEFADRAMNEFASKAQQAIANATWSESLVHIPYDDGVGDVPYRQRTSGARCARKSYARINGKNDDALSASLLDRGHWSAFEHSAVWSLMPLTSAIASKPEDFNEDCWGWESYRATCGA